MKRLCAATLCLTLAACMPSSQYTPRDSARLKLIYLDGRGYYVRDGRQFSATGLFGDGLLDAVSADPDASRIAHAAHTKKHIGAACMLLGLGAMIAATVILGHISSETRDNPDYHVPRGTEYALFGSMIGAPILVLVGSYDLAEAQILANDAVNRYNDDVDEAARASYPPPPKNARPPLPP